MFIFPAMIMMLVPMIIVLLTKDVNMTLLTVMIKTIVLKIIVVNKMDVTPNL
jgi:hypothetical protein